MDEAEEMLPFAAETIRQLAESGGGSLSDLPQEFDKEKNWTNWVDSKRRRIRVISIWYKTKGVWMFDYLVGPIALCPPGHDCMSPYKGEEEETE